MPGTMNVRNNPIRGAKVTNVNDKGSCMMDSASDLFGVHNTDIAVSNESAGLRLSM